MNLLIIGDIVGRPGRQAVRNFLPDIVRQYNIEFIIANAENASGGRGLTREVMNELLGAGIDVLTMGNHVWDNKEIFSFIDEEPRLIRPANYPPPCPGQGYHVYQAGFNQRIAVINVSGRVFMPALDCPFRTTEQILADLPEVDYIIIDFHAEATSEKQAFGYYFDGKVSAVVGTHTHVQTADERIMPDGTAYITDLGMTGPIESVLGMDRQVVINKFLLQRPVRFEVAKGPSQLQGVVLELDEQTRRVAQIKRISYKNAE
ncbi:MAG: TIGR00282 family metallophosphoesterase [Syntrophomonadaceae bacterium]|nr:TIGR00282 family metallophosphoesterase [Bacillota bacterium]NLM88491.1 TIGR00282 family metallophosphoesterase [Syntrophomonadaceae bacterium]HAA09214.1 TIGR00282 family metallophosphoesterase [Syntrophomonas sp.]HQA49939.1 TIGR00282 family metallophosphoesterase [Syntrophomonadaceae bacterium]HQD91366.1 TIGR00282 family metallophosphoesterase [Syntrophomonadaceae bacterium]